MAWGLACGQWQHVALPPVVPGSGCPPVLSSHLPPTHPPLIPLQLLFRDNLAEVLAGAVPGERQMEAKFRAWLQRCHASLDRSVRFEALADARTQVGAVPRLGGWAGLGCEPSVRCASKRLPPPLLLLLLATQHKHITLPPR